MRLFLAINMTDDVKNKINASIIKVKRNIKKDLKWVKKENWHLTLKFFGEIDEKQSMQIKEKIKQVAGKVEQQSIILSQIAAFPDLNCPRVIYLAIDQGKKKIIALHDELERQFVNIGIPADNNDFTPHLTIARVKRNSNPKKIAAHLEKYSDLSFSNICLKVEKISLMKSVLQRNGPVYEKIYTATLKKD